MTEDGAAVTTKRTLITSFLVNSSDVVLNFIVAIFTGSAVMAAEALHGLADVSAVLLLMVGHKQSSKGSTKKHPFGYGKELYFWTLLAGFIVCTITASLSFNFGLEQLRHPEPVENIWLAYIMLGFGSITNGYAFSLSARKLLGRRRVKKIWRSFLESYLVGPKTTFVLDLMGATAAVIGLITLVIYQITGNQRFDGIGAMLIGVTLAVFGFILLLSIRDLITGRAAPAHIQQKINKSALGHPAVNEVLDLKTMIIGSDRVLVNIEVNLSDDLTTNELEKAIDEIKESIRERVPGASHIQVELETPDRELN